MPTYDYKCKECGKVFEVLHRFSELDKEVSCPNCNSKKKREFSLFCILKVEGETVAGSGYGKTEFPQVSPGLGRGMGR